jgi:hypothetical protein
MNGMRSLTSQFNSIKVLCVFVNERKKWTETSCKSERRAAVISGNERNNRTMDEIAKT